VASGGGLVEVGGRVCEPRRSDDVGGGGVGV
jgi:hypothetical protein